MIIIPFEPVTVRPDELELATSKLATGDVTVPLFVNVCELAETKINRVYAAVALIVPPALLVTFPPILSQVLYVLVPAVSVIVPLFEIFPLIVAVMVELIVKGVETATVKFPLTVIEAVMFLAPVPDNPKFPL